MPTEEVPQPRSLEEIAGDLKPLLQQAADDLGFDQDKIVQALTRLIPEADSSDESGVPDLLTELERIAIDVDYSFDELIHNMLFAVDNLRRGSAEAVPPPGDDVEQARNTVTPPDAV